MTALFCRRKGIAIFSISSDAIQIARILRDEQEPVIKIGNMKSQSVVSGINPKTKTYKSGSKKEKKAGKSKEGYERV